MVVVVRVSSARSTGSRSLQRTRDYLFAPMFDNAAQPSYEEKAIDYYVVLSMIDIRACYCLMEPVLHPVADLYVGR